MTTTDYLIPYYVWFTYGFGVISILMGIMNFGMLAITLITVKGIYIPLWMIPVVAGVMVIICVCVGRFFEKYGIWDRVTSHQNKNANPESVQICRDVAIIKKMLEDR
jgi:hypothetical protein